MRILLNHKTWRISHQENTKNLFLICTLNKSITFALKFRTKRKSGLLNLFTYTYYSLLLLLLRQESRCGMFVCMK